MSSEKKASDEVLIERERQKTKRLFIYFGFMALISIFAIFYIFKDDNGKRTFDLNLKEGKLSLSVDKPIVQQVDQKTAEYKTTDKEIKFTYGSINSSVIDELSKKTSVQISPYSFTGENYINKDIGYLFTVTNPANWRLTYHPGGLNNLNPINILIDINGTGEFNVVAENASYGMNIEEYTQANLQTLNSMGFFQSFPDISYGNDGITSFLIYNNTLDGLRTYQKLTKSDNRFFVATAKYDPLYTNPQIINELEQMVTSFTLIK